MNYAEMIRSYLHSPEELEKMYRQDAVGFAAGLEVVYAEEPELPVLQFWRVRLQSIQSVEETGLKADRVGDSVIETVAVESRTRKKIFDVLFVLMMCLLYGLFASNYFRTPGLGYEDITPGFGYGDITPGFGLTLCIAIYFLKKRRIGWKGGLALIGVIGIGLCYSIFLNKMEFASVGVLASFHMAFFVWAICGIAYQGGKWRDLQSRMEFVWYNGELTFYTMLLLALGLIVSGMIFLFFIHYISIWFFYLFNGIKYLFITIPILAIFLTDLLNKQLTKALLTLARSFSVLMLGVLSFYLLSIITGGQNPFDRPEFLLSVDILLVLVLGLIWFIHSRDSGENHTGKSWRWSDYVNYALCGLTVMVDVIAFAAIIYRISEYGISPNRLTALGLNVLIFFNLLGVVWQYTLTWRRSEGLARVKHLIATYLPVYAVWCLVMAVVLPLVFGRG